MKIPLRYLPFGLSRKDRKKQASSLQRSRKLYKKGQYFTRPKVKSFKNKPSGHITRARSLYKVDNISPNPTLAKATGCSVGTLHKIVKKGEGAYFSSGSRPNQTAHSWGYARLASAITGGKAAAVDFSIIEQGCDHNKRAYRLAAKSRRVNGHGQRATKKIVA
uniref:DUF5824 domain-containing protein n=1 Tax=viral metagenome TaxID=1070528 RepID=A0A6C0B6L7_9ZZZZ